MDGVIDESLVYKTIKTCYKQGARYLSISSSGEPTLSPLTVTKTLKWINGCKGVKFSPINLYSNGIIIGEDKSFCETYLSLWKRLGLTTIYVTVHDVNEVKNARAYGIKNYPPLSLVLSRIHGAGLLMRANLVLSKKTINTFNKFVSTVEYLKKMGVDFISAWPIRNMEDKIDSKLVPDEKELDKMEKWVKDKGVRLLREKSRKVYQTGQKLTLFPNGKLSNTWYNY